MSERELFEDWLKKEYPMIHQWYSDGLEEWKTKVEYMFVAWQSQQSKIDELQARVDEALRFYNEAKSPHNIGMIQMAIYLKGNKDENY